MLYEDKEKAEIERVYSVFQDYIRTSPYLEWVWSDKMGYILIVISTEKRYVEEGIVILNAEMLCDRLPIPQPQAHDRDHQPETGRDKASSRSCPRPYL